MRRGYIVCVALRTYQINKAQRAKICFFRSNNSEIVDASARKVALCGWLRVVSDAATKQLTNTHLENAKLIGSVVIGPIDTNVAAVLRSGALVLFDDADAAIPHRGV